MKYSGRSLVLQLLGLVLSAQGNVKPRRGESALGLTTDPPRRGHVTGTPSPMGTEGFPVSVGKDVGKDVAAGSTVSSSSTAPSTGASPAATQEAAKGKRPITDKVGGSGMEPENKKPKKSTGVFGFFSSTAPEDKAAADEGTGTGDSGNKKDTANEGVSFRSKSMFGAGAEPVQIVIPQVPFAKVESYTKELDCTFAGVRSLLPIISCKNEPKRLIAFTNTEFDVKKEYEITFEEAEAAEKAMKEVNENRPGKGEILILQAGKLFYLIGLQGSARVYMAIHLKKVDDDNYSIIEQKINGKSTMLESFLLEAAVGNFKFMKEPASKLQASEEQKEALASFGIVLPESSSGKDTATKN